MAETAARSAAARTGAADVVGLVVGGVPAASPAGLTQAAVATATVAIGVLIERRLGELDLQQPVVHEERATLGQPGEEGDALGVLRFGGVECSDDE